MDNVCLIYPFALGTVCPRFLGPLKIQVVLSKYSRMFSSSPNRWLPQKAEAAFELAHYIAQRKAEERLGGIWWDLVGSEDLVAQNLE